MVDILWIAFWTLVIYSGVATLIITVSDNDDDVTAYFAFGIVGCSIGIVVKTIYLVKYIVKDYIPKRSIFEDSETGERYICKLSDTRDIKLLNRYKLKRRYATKEEWKDIPCFDRQVIKEARKTCNYCMYDRVCNSWTGVPICKHDECDTILEFDKFMKK